MADEYERKHMPGVGAILYRHKMTAPRWMLGLTAGVPFGLASVTALTFAIGNQPLPAVGMFLGGCAVAALLSALSVTFATSRIAVSEGEVHVQLGFAGPKIPIADVASVRIGPSGTRSYGIGALKLFSGATIFKLLGDNERAVHIERRGQSPIILVCKEPEAMAQAIQEAMARHARKDPQVRVEEAPQDRSAAELEAETESGGAARAVESEPR